MVVDIDLRVVADFLDDRIKSDDILVFLAADSTEGQQGCKERENDMLFLHSMSFQYLTICYNV